METDPLKAIRQAVETMGRFAQPVPHEMAYVSRSTLERMRQSPDYTVSPAGIPLYLIEGVDSTWWAIELPDHIYNEIFPVREVND